MLDAQMAAEGNLYDDFDEAFSEGGEEEEDESEGEEEPFDLAAALAGGGAVEGAVEGTRFGAGPAVPVARGRRAFRDEEDGVDRCGECGWELLGCQCEF